MQVDVEGPHPLERGDIFLLCSDGLSGQVNDRVIGSVVTALHASAEAACGFWSTWPTCKGARTTRR